MALLDVYRGESKRIDLSFTNDDGTPMDLSNFTLYYTVKRNYSESGALISAIVTGHDVAVSGLTHIDLTSSQTAICPGEYVAGFTLVSSTTGVSIFNTDGLRIIRPPILTYKMPNLSINSSVNAVYSTGYRLNIVTVSGPRGADGAPGQNGADGAGGVYVSGSALIPSATLTGTNGITVVRDGDVVIFSGQNQLDYSATIAQTGSILDNKIDTASGYLDTKINTVSGFTFAVSGALQGLINANSGAQIKVTGSTSLSIADFIGIGGLLIFHSGDKIFVSGGSSSAVTPEQLNALSGWAEGSIASTGSTLYSLINTSSGYLQLELTELSNRLIQSGANLIALNAATSGVLAGSIQQTGSTLNSKIDSLSGYANSAFATPTNVYDTGSALVSLIGLTGQAAWNAANNNGINLSGNLAATGATLLALITAASAGVSSVNGASGVVSIAGAGGVSVTTNGQTITVSGEAPDYSSLATKVELVATGTTLHSQIVATNQLLSGQTGNFYPRNNPSGYITGNYYPANNPSGFITGNFYPLNNPNQYATSGNLAATGEAATAHANSIGSILSGRLTDTGAALLALIAANSAGVTSLNAASGALQLTGAGSVFVTVNGQTITLSGSGVTPDLSALATKVELIATGASVVSHANGIGSILSGKLHETGANLVSAINSLSGYAAQTYYPNTNPSGFVSGNFYPASNPNQYATSGNLVTTGTAAVQHANGIGINLSGNLTDSGIALNTHIDQVSGFVHAVSGEIGQRIILTGLAAVQHTNSAASILSGKLTDTGAILMSLISAASAGVSSINGASGVVSIAGVGGITVETDGQSIFISGEAPDYSTLATTANLHLTGAILNDRITVLSGYSDNKFATIANLAQTGAQAIIAANANATNLSGNLTQTGIALIGYIESLSGYSNSVFATIANLQSTGSNVLAHANSIGTSLSGQLTQTGILLGARIDAVSGLAQSISGGIEARIVATGNSAVAHANGVGSNLSGNLTQTGVSLGAKVDSLSGYSDATFAKIATVDIISGNLIQTGATLDGRINTLTTNLTQTGVNLIARDNAISGVLQGQINQLYPASNPSGYITGLNTGNFVSASQLASTGQQAWTAANNNAINLSGNNAQTGAALLSHISAVSGGLETRIFATGNAAVTHANGIGSIVSGNLTTTGSTLDTKINALSGYSNTTFATIVTTNAISGNLIQSGVALGAKIDSVSGWAVNVVSGGLNVRIAATGSAAVTHANSIGSVISGNITQTGSTLNTRINSLSGWANTVVSGGLETRIFATGGAAVTHSNSIGSTISGNLTQTGVAILSQINQVSGGLEARIFATGASAVAHTNSIGQTLSGNLTQTGVALGARIDALSGYVTGVSGVLYGYITLNSTNLSGNLYATGLTLNQKIEAVSGYVLGVSGALQALIDSNPGSNSDGINLSGNLYVTGSTLDQKINALSGYALFNFSTGSSPAFNNQFRAMAARYSTAIAQTLTTSYETIGFEVKSFDSENAATGSGITFAWVAPVSGYYNVSATLESFAVSTANNQYLQAAIFVDGVERFISVGRVASSSQGSNVTVNGVVEALSGQAISVRAASSIGASRTLSARSEANYLSISRVGGFAQYVTGAGMTGATDGFVATGTILSYTTGILTGADFVYINHLRYAFPTIPRVTVELEAGPEGFIYAHAISGRSTTGFYLLFSDVVAETGMVANIIAKS